jgi:hypothetical protein
MALARTKLTPLPCAWNSPTKAKSAPNNVMDLNNIYLNFIVYYRLARRGQKQKAVPEPEFKPFDLAYLTGAPARRNQSQNTAGTENRNTRHLTPSRRKCRPTWSLSSSSYSS